MIKNYKQKKIETKKFNLKKENPELREVMIQDGMLTAKDF